MVTLGQGTAANRRSAGRRVTAVVSRRFRPLPCCSPMLLLPTPTARADATAPPGRDRFLDVVKAVAVVRVVLWHTLSWPWLSWIPAMPVMFFANGALLDRSLGRTGHWATLGSRLRRLLVPFWVYAAASVAVMVVAGWRPGLPELLPWVVPLVDPVGSAWGAELWIPLWYVRAYLWFVLLAGPIRALTRRWPVPSVVASIVGVVALGRWEATGTSVPMALGDLLAYSPFVVAGMLYHQRGAPRPGRCLAAAAVGAAVAVLFVRVPPGWDGVVNRSWTLTVCVGVVGLGLATAARSRLGAVGGHWGRLVDLVGARALTVYLWQGFGLLAASHLVRRAGLPAAAADVLALVVVGAAVAAAVVVFGPVEDRAGRRGPRLHRATAAFRPAGAVLLVVLLSSTVAAAAPTATAGAGPGERALDDAPLSGRAVVARAALVGDAIAGGSGGPVAGQGPAGSDRVPAGGAGSVPPPEARLAAITREWISANAGSLAPIGFSSLEAAVVDADGRAWSLEWARDRNGGRVDVGPAPSPGAGDIFPWWSMTKAATTAWLLRSAEAGRVRTDDALSRWVPESPRSADMTLEQLARHTAGVPRDEGRSFAESTPLGDVEAWYRDGRLLFEPGTGFHYSRTGYHLLALALERAEGRSWSDAVTELGERSGAVLRFDDERSSATGPTDPDGRGYRGALWASGGIWSTPADAARFFSWLPRAGLGASSVEAMTRFSADPSRWYYGLGVTPRCPCAVDGDRLTAASFGADGPGGSVATRIDGRATVVLVPDAWFDDGAPRRELFDLESRLLEAASR